MQIRSHIRRFVTRFLALVLTRVMNSGVQITPVICSSLRPSMETGKELISLFAKCLDTAHNTSREPRLPRSEDMLPWALNATVSWGFQRQLENLDTNYGNFNRHPGCQGKFQTSPLSIASHNHASFLLQSFSPLSHYFLVFSLPLSRQRPSCHKTSRSVTFCQMRQNTK